MSSLDLPPVTLLLQEIQTVTSSMRRNQRWANTSSSSFQTSQAPLPPYLSANRARRRAGLSSSSSSHNTSSSLAAIRRAGGAAAAAGAGGRSSVDTNPDEGDLMDGFVELRRNVTDIKDVTHLAPLAVVDPFLALIRSPLTSGPITSLALTSLHALIIGVLPLYLTTPPPRAIVVDSTPLQIALAHITSALSQCRFPSSSPQQDELVLLRLLRVIESLAARLPFSHASASTSGTSSSMLEHMSDESVCELLEVGLGMLARARLSEGLRNTAQSCVQVIVRACFVRLKSLTPEDVERLLTAATEAEAEREKREKRREQRLSSKASIGSSASAVTAAAAATIGGQKGQATDGAEQQRASTDLEKRTSLDKGAARHSLDKASQPDMDLVEEEEDLGPPPFTPYGLPTILELLRVLVALLNPSDQAHTDSMRLAALSILNTALEVGGSSLGKWPELREGVLDEGCRYLFQLTRSDSPALLAQSLRTTSTLFSTMLPHLKLQLELFLSYLIDRLTPPSSAPVPNLLAPQHTGVSVSRPATPAVGQTADGSVNGGGEATASDPMGAVGGTSTPTVSSTPKAFGLLPPVPGETRELMLETLTQIALRPSFMVDCWTNFDCSTDSEDIFERLVAFLTRGVYPPYPPKADGTTHFFEGLDASQLLSLEILLSYVSAMTDRLESQSSEPWPESTLPASTVVGRKARKGVLLRGASMFNQKPKTGLAYLEKEGIIDPKTVEPELGDTDDSRRHKAIARFLRSSSRLDKKLIGEYISRPDQLDLLKAFIGLFDFKGKSVADAMRELLETFRLPGESQPISRITETFAEHFFASGPSEIATQDAVYVLAYSVIMLNTDLHNPQNRKRMTIDDYKRNLRGVNGGKDFDPEYLAGIHESIRKKEIILPEEHVGQPGFDYAWKSLMQRSRTAGSMITCNTAVFDESMFRISWRPLIASIAYAFTTSAQDEHVIQKAITGFRQCATLAGHFHLPEVFDAIVLSLSSATGLLDDRDDNDAEAKAANHPVVERDGQHVTVSPLAIRFGQSYRSQLATVVLFTIANGNGGAIREGWLQIFEMFQTLFLHSLLPDTMLQMEDFLAGQTTIPMKSAAPASTADRRTESSGGLLSTLSSYLLSPYGGADSQSAVETTEEEVENTLVAVDCLSSCKLEALYAEILSLDVDALLPALRALRHLAEIRTVNRLERSVVGRSDTGSPVRARIDGQLPYDPACVFLLETMISLATRGKDHIAETWPVIFEYLSALLGSAQSYSVLLIERAVVGLLRLCLIISAKPDLRDQLYIALDVLRSLPSSVLSAVSEQLMAGVAKILSQDPAVVSSQTEWGLIIALFRATVANPEASKVTLSIVQNMVDSNASASRKPGPELTVDNFAGVVALLDEFATAAGGAIAQRQGSSGRRSTSSQTALGPAVERGLTALDSLYELRNVIPGLTAQSNMGEKDAWNAFWLPPLLVISKQCVNGHRDIRSRAISYLQRLLLSPQLLASEQASLLPTILDRVLFPVMDELLKPQTYERDPRGMAETRLKAATLLCKIFLQYVVRLVESESEAVGGLFVRVLDKLERFMRGERDILNEAGESLKNVVLVMHSSDLLVPPPPSPAADGADARTTDQKNLWKASAERIERILPGFMADSIVAPAAAAQAAQQQQQQQQKPPTAAGQEQKQAGQ